MYYKLYIQKEPAPLLALLALILIFLVIFVGLLTKKTTERKVAREENVFDVKIANITANSAVIAWQSKKPTLSNAYLSLSSSEFGQKKIDSRDFSGKQMLRNNHFITLKNLKPSTKYYIRISDKKIFGKTLSQIDFKTVPASNLVSQRAPLYGKVVDKNGTPVKEAIIFAKIKKAGLLAAMTKADGSFLISLCCLFDQDKLEPIDVEKDDIVEYELFANGLKSKFTVSIADSSPVERNIVLGESINLVAQKKKQQAQVLSSQSERPDNIVSYNNVDIFYPVEQAIVPGVRPIFKGRAASESVVTLTIRSTKKTFKITTDKNGNWSFIPDFDLDPGNHMLTLEAVDRNNKKVNLVRKFTIAKSGETVLGEATPEATIIPTENPTPTVNPTIIIGTDIAGERNKFCQFWFV